LSGTGAGSLVDGCEVEMVLGAAVGCEVVVPLQSRGKYKFQPVFGSMMLSVHEVDIWQPPEIPTSKDVHAE
jgi:hypothetical protein